MENTAFSTTTYLESARPSLHRLGLLFETPKYRPAVFEEIQSDVERFIANAARVYTDTSCPELQFEELVAEGRSKLAYLIAHGYLVSTVTRLGFFKVFATTVNNHFRSQVQKYRYTEKRTGVKPPPRNEIFKGQNRPKTMEICADDPDNHVQIPDRGYNCAETEMREVMEDFGQFLTPLENLVVAQLVEPNARAWSVAYVDAHRGRMPGQAIKVRLAPVFLAYGIGVPVSLFEKAVLSIRQKYTDYRRMTPDQQEERIHRSATLAQLAKVFNLQIPPVEDIVIRRMLTLAARMQHEKCNDQVKTMLQEVGAYVPAVIAGELGCYGVLYKRTDQRCQSCGLNKPCRVKAANLGLDKMTLSPQLLGSKGARTPAIIAENAPVDASQRDMEVMVYLDENFQRTTYRDRLHWVHNDRPGKTRYLFHVETSSKGLIVKFVEPSDALRTRLQKMGKAWCAPPNFSASETIGYIDQHAKDTLVHG